MPVPVAHIAKRRFCTAGFMQRTGLPPVCPAPNATVFAVSVAPRAAHPEVPPGPKHKTR